MAWWIWVLGGLALLVAEVAAPGGFFAVFFGAGAILVGALKAFGWDGPSWAEWLVFTVLSVVSLAIFRRPLMRHFNLTPGKPVDRLEGETAVVTDDVAPGGVGKAEMRGTSWTARTAGTAPLPKGRRCRVERIEGLTLWLRPE
ncbi:MAG TPA: NfeD family protein [Vicinamibacteria bacterium]|nr:NfeD family protein [Vicinamibacteria bacterium]